MARPEPTAVLQETLRALVEANEKDQLIVKQAFIPADTFRGPKKGYYFSSGSQGVGYYEDLSVPKPTLAEKVAELELRKPAKEVAKVLDAEELLREAEEQAGDDQLQLVDSKGLKRLVLSFERKYKENMEARMKYSDQPDKFMDSELDLDEEVRRLQAVAGSPELYPELVRLNAVPSLLNLLSHENSDIAGDVLELFNELTDSDVVEDSEEEARELVSCMVEHNGLELLVQRLLTLDENVPEEATGVFNALGIIENMVDVKPEVAEEVVRRTKVLKWILNRLKPREFDSNKQAASEVLALLLQTNPDTIDTRLAQYNGIDTCLQAVAPYKNRDPHSEEEAEYVNNLFNAMCACLMTPEGRSLFVAAEGVELMILILKQKRSARLGALKTLDFALTRSPAACERFVDMLGLKTLFAIFMGRSKVSFKKSDNAQAGEIEERVVSLVSSLFQGLARGSRRDRLAAKFVENEFEKCDRLMEIYTRYTRRVATEEHRLFELAQEEEEAADPEYQYLARQEAGLYTLQQVALIVGNLWFVGDLGVRKRLLQLLHQQGLTLGGLRGVLKEFHDNVGLEGGEDEANRARARVMRMLSALGYEEPSALPNWDAAAAPQPEMLPDADDLKEGAREGGGEEEADPFNLGGLDESGALAKPLRKERKVEGNGFPDEEKSRSKQDVRDRDRDEERRRARDKDRDRDKEHRDRDRDLDRRDKEKDRGEKKERREHKEKDRERGEKHRDKDKDRERSRHKDHKRRREGDDDREERKKERHK